MRCLIAALVITLVAGLARAHDLWPEREDGGLALHYGHKYSEQGGALVAAGWLSVNASALLMALALGLQPVIARAEDGQPLFFPFGLSITLPAVMVPHALIGIGEGVLTLLMFRLLSQRGWVAPR